MTSKNPVLETFGIEFETDSVTAGDLPDALRGIFNPVRDASIETDYTESKCGILINETTDLIPKSNSMRSSKVTLGTEFTTIPLSVDSNYFIYFKYLTDFLVSVGEPVKSKRAGLHIHVAFPKDITAIKNALILGGYFEDLFYLLGGNGYPHRSDNTDGVYCRPITKFGPPVVRVKNGRKLAQVFVLDKLIKANNLEEFMLLYGDTNVRNITHYNPVRYTWLNLYSLFNHGTIEFRIFNKTLNPYYITALVKLCVAFATYAVKVGDNLDKDIDVTIKNSIYDKRDKESIYESFKTLANITGLDDGTIDILFNIINRTSVSTIRPGYIMTHVREYRTLWQETEYEPEFIKETDVKSPEFTDIHILRNE